MSQAARIFGNCRRSLRSGVLLAFLLLIPAFLKEARAEEVFVQVSSAAIRGAPQQWARTVAQVRYGDALTVIQAVAAAEEGVPGWLQVRVGKSQGYIHRSAVTDRKVVVQGRGTGAGVQNAQSGDIVLAGKGFNSQVEGAYAARKANANFPEVDRMLARKISDGEVASFIQSGKLGGVK